MKSTVAAAAAIVFAIAATTASAGVVISQKLVVDNPAATPKVNKADQTVMVQGHKQKVITGDLEVITDLDAGKMYFINPKSKNFVQVEIPPTGMLGRRLAREGLFVGFKKFDRNPHKLNGYTCQDYIGGQTIAYSDIGVTQCVASDAPGATEYLEFKKAMMAKLKGTPFAPKGELPAGIPVSSITTTTAAIITPTGGIPPETIAKIKAENAKNKVTTSFNVSKIEVKNIPADTFTVPAAYNKQEMQEPRFNTEGAMPATAPNASGPSLTEKPAKPAVPAPH
jgi:hypothetical protein